MAKTYLSTVKYEVKAKYEITGLVEKPDIVGAIFGQSEGLLGEDMDLKQLQQNGKIGRIEISVNKGKGKTTGEIIIPSSLDQVKTSILAATMETVEKVGPCEAKVEIVNISDVRKEKRGQITDRAKQLLQKMQKFEGVESDAIAEGIRTDVRAEKAVTYKGMTAGPDAENSPTLVVVEGRADVLKLLSYGINDVIEMNGSNISNDLIDLCKKKEVTMLVDGDRGGELNAKKLASLTNVNFVAKAPDGKEVEELTQKEILQSLKRREEIREFLNPRTQRRDNHRGNDRNDNYPRNNNYDRRDRQNNRYSRNDQRGSYGGNNSERSYGRNDQRGSYGGNDSNRSYGRSDSSRGYDRNNSERSYGRNDSNRSFGRDNQRGSYNNRRFDDKRTYDKPYEKREVVVETPKEIKALEKDFEKIKGKLKARLYDSKKKKIKDVKVNEMIEAIEKTRKKIDTIAFDGIITKRLLETAESKGVKNIVGVRKSTANSDKVNTYTM